MGGAEVEAEEDVESTEGANEEFDNDGEEGGMQRMMLQPVSQMGRLMRGKKLLS